MASGANSRKAKSARESAGTWVRSTTSYQPQVPLPKATMAEESPNSSQAGRAGPSTAQPCAMQESAAARAAPARPKSPMNRATEGEPQPKEAPTV